MLLDPRPVTVEAIPMRPAVNLCAKSQQGLNWFFLVFLEPANQNEIPASPAKFLEPGAVLRTSVFFSDQMSQSNKASAQIAQMEGTSLAYASSIPANGRLLSSVAWFVYVRGHPKLYHFHRMELSKTRAACTVPFLWAWILDHNFMPSRIKFL